MGLNLIMPDTNVLILAMSGKEPYSSYLKTWILEKRLVFSSIVVAEFLCGATSGEENVFNSLLKPFPVLSVDLVVAQMGAFYRRKYMKMHKKIGLPDCLIAATAKINNVRLATLNNKDYPMKDIERENL